MVLFSSLVILYNSLLIAIDPIDIRWDHKKGDEYNLKTYNIARIVSENANNAFLDQMYEGKLTVRWIDKDDNAYLDGRYKFHQRDYLSRFDPYVFVPGYDSQSSYYQTPDGAMRVERPSHFPSLRSIPQFPKRKLRVGDQWILPGHIVENLNTFGGPKYAIIPAQVHYKFKRMSSFKGDLCAVINVSYKVFNSLLENDNPVMMEGEFDGEMYMSINNGYIRFFVGNYTYKYTFPKNRFQSFSMIGHSYGTVDRTRRVLASHSDKNRQNYDKDDNQGPNDIKESRSEDLKDSLREDRSLATNDPATNNPATNDPVTNDPATNDPATNDPDTNDPATNDPVTNGNVRGDVVPEDPQESKRDNSDRGLSRVVDHLRSQLKLDAGEGDFQVEGPDVLLRLGNVLFDINGATLRANVLKILDRIASWLLGNEAFSMRVVGHTDTTGDPVLRKILSTDRALAVQDYLTRRGVSAQRIQVFGCGAQKPIADNTTYEGRQKNRRVDFLFHKEDSKNKTDPQKNTSEMTPASRITPCI